MSDVSELDWEIPDQEFSEELRAVGWAPGGYICKCCECGKRHQAAKRSRLCVACAKASAERASQQAEVEPPKPTLPEIIARLRNLGPQIGDIAADALETLAGENERKTRQMEWMSSEYAKLTEFYQDAVGQLAALAPVVEAARKQIADGVFRNIALEEALATLEAANVQA
jgi:hypothetical protein